MGKQKEVTKVAGVKEKLSGIERKEELIDTTKAKINQRW
jgi:hypothetical protein